MAPGVQQKWTSLPGRLLVSIFGPPTWHNVRGWLILIAAVVVLRWLWFESFVVPTGSMEPTIHGDPRFLRGDYLAVNKFVYGLRYPFMNKRIWRGSDPQRFDIVVFKSVDPEDPGRTLVKRLMGLPGERIHIANGTVHVNGKPVVLPPGMPPVYYTDIPGLSPDHLRAEVMALNPVDRQGYLQRYMYQYGQYPPPVFGVREEDEYAVVPPDHYLFLGDNSENSRDGRYFGWVPNENIIGRAICTYWPFSRWRDFTGFSHTWWGRCLLFGIPGLLVFYELCRSFVLDSWRVWGDGVQGVPRGTRLLINRLAFGLRAPFGTRRLTRGRAARPGELVVYYDRVDSPASAHFHLCLGRIAGVSPEAGVTVMALDPKPDSISETVVARADLIGSVTGVWWPMKHIGAPKADHDGKEKQESHTRN